MSLFGRLIHYSVDAVLLSTVLAGVRRSSGFKCVSILSVPMSNIFVDCTITALYSLDTEKIGDPTLRSITDRFLSIGETAFDYAQVTAAGSSYFKRIARDR